MDKGGSRQGDSGGGTAAHQVSHDTLQYEAKQAGEEEEVTEGLTSRQKQGNFKL